MVNENPVVIKVYEVPVTGELVDTITSVLGLVLPSRRPDPIRKFRLQFLWYNPFDQKFYYLEPPPSLPHVRRPPNAFICARRNLMPRDRQVNTIAFSKLMGKLWKSAKGSLLQRYFQYLAVLKDEDHKALYPGWEYRPQKKSTKEPDSPKKAGKPKRNKVQNPGVSKAYRSQAASTLSGDRISRYRDDCLAPQVRQLKQKRLSYTGTWPNITDVFDPRFLDYGELVDSQLDCFTTPSTMPLYDSMLYNPLDERYPSIFQISDQVAQLAHLK